ncbi:MAG TPA: hypothetical protein VKK79_20050 [Candidatus Lokiarchaeia archaeon]|nr:hypothetical protein [Candidatus Lokiarchaeia archaeon]
MDLEQAALLATDSIFTDLPSVDLDDVAYDVHALLRVGLRFVDIEVEGEKYRVMEQNPNKASKWAEMARNGSQIAWIFKGGRYYARVVDGQFTLLAKKKE